MLSAVTGVGHKRDHNKYVHEHMALNTVQLNRGAAIQRETPSWELSQ